MDEMVPEDEVIPSSPLEMYILYSLPDVTASIPVILYGAGVVYP